MREDEEKNGVAITARTRGELFLGHGPQVHLLDLDCGGECGGKVLGEVLGYVSVVCIEKVGKCFLWRIFLIWTSDQRSTQYLDIIAVRILVPILLTWKRPIGTRCTLFEVYPSIIQEVG